LSDFVPQTKNNYRPWSINFQDFYKHPIDQRLKFLINFGLLAPSGHNSQPWKFRIESNSVIIAPNFSRSLNHSDPNNRQLYISLGCCAENILIAADYYGFQTETKVVNKTGHSEVHLLFNSTLATKVSDNTSHLIFSIPKRHTNRNRYLIKALPSEIVNELASISTENVKVEIVQSEQKNKLAHIAHAATIEIMDDQKFRHELSDLLNSNYTNSKIGMTGAGFGIPGPLSLVLAKIIKMTNINRLTRKPDLALLVQQTPAFLIVQTPSDTTMDWINCGRIFENFWLRAERIGLAVAPLAACIQLKQYSKQLKEVLQTALYPQIFSRIGFSQKPGLPSPRLSLEEVLEK
jgi:nitroreductase